MLTIQVNGVSHTVDAPEDKPLLWACSIVHLKPGCTYSFYVRAKNPMGESGNKSGSIPVFVEKPSAANNDTKVMFPKRFSENPRLSVPPIPAIVTRTSSEAVVLLQQSADHNGVI